MSLCGACYLYKDGECLEYGGEYFFDDDVNCEMFILSDKAKEILLEHEKELVN